MAATVADFPPLIDNPAPVPARARSLAWMGRKIIAEGYDPRHLAGLDPLFAEISAVVACELQAYATTWPGP